MHRRFGIDGQGLNIALSPDGHTLALSGTTGVLVWDLRANQVMCKLPRRDGVMSFAPDGKSLLIGHNENSVGRLYLYATTGELLGLYEGLPMQGGSERSHFDIVRLGVGGQVLALGATVNDRRGTNVRAVKTRLGQEATVWRHPEFADPRDSSGKPIEAAAFSADGKMLATADNSRLFLWDLATGQSRQIHETNSRPYYWIAFSAPSKTILGSFPETVVLWDTVTGKKLTQFPLEPASVPSAKGTAIFQGAGDDTLLVFDATSGKKLDTLKGKRAGTPNDAGKKDIDSRQLYIMAVSPEGKWVLTVSKDGLVALWDIAAKKQSGMWEPPGKTARWAFAPGEKLFLTGDADGALRIWELPSFKVRAFIPKGWPGGITTFATDGCMALLGDSPTTAQVIDLAGAEVRCRLEGHSSAITKAAFSPDGQTIATGCLDGTVRLWDPVTGQQRLSLDGHKSKINSLTFHPHGRMLVTCDNDGNIRLWEAPLAEEIGGESSAK